MSAMADSEAILEFWFGSADMKTKILPRKEWFAKDTAFDESIQKQFGPDIEKAAKGELDGWRSSSGSCLALVLLLDQFPRNVFRGTARAFANDSLALGHALYALDHGLDLEVAPVPRWFFFLPLTHSESLERQEDALKRFKALGEGTPAWQQAVDSAAKHLAIIERFGRFPGRNEALGRDSTPEELEFLKTEGSSF